MSAIQRVPFAPGERFDMMWGCCAGTHASSLWQNNGNDYYAGAGTVCVAPIDGEIVRAGVPGIGQGERVGIQGAGIAAYLAHMHRLRVRVGQRVRAGDPVGEIWPFPGIPDHLHFSLASGSYGGGRFLDPWKTVQAMAAHITGRTYEAPRQGSASPTPSPAPAARHYLEELPARLGGNGPDVLGPWTDTPGHRRNRDERVQTMRDSGRLAAPMDGDGLLYIYVYRSGTHGRPFRWGPWADADRAKRAREVLMGDGRLTAPRHFIGPANSFYPWI